MRNPLIGLTALVFVSNAIALSACGKNMSPPSDDFLLDGQGGSEQGGGATSHASGGRAGSAGHASTSPSNAGGSRSSNMGTSTGTDRSAGAAGNSNDTATCGDEHEPNDTSATASKLADITDCDPPAQAKGVLSGPNDGDWYVYNGIDAGDWSGGTVADGCGIQDIIAPYMATSTPATLCIFVKQNNDGPYDGCAMGTASDEMMGAGFIGCCGTGEVQVADFGIHITDNSATVLMRVLATVSTAMCTPYTLAYQFNKH